MSLSRMWLVLALVVALVVAVAPARAAEGDPVDNVLVKRVGTNGKARWERIERSQLRSAAAGSEAPILAVSEDAILRQSSAPNDPFYPEQWNFTQVNAETAWAYATGLGVVVAVVDSGLTPGPDLACRTFVSPYDAESGGTQLADVADGTGHGTHVTGTVAQCTNNALRVAGLAHGATIMPVRSLDDSGTGSAAWIANGIAHAVENGADIINMSLGMECGNDVWPTCGVAAIDIEIDAAVAAGVILVAAAGNNSSATMQYPANHPDVIGVGATTSAGTHADYSNTGPKIYMVAPGGDTVDRDGSGDADLIWQERPDENGISAIIGMYGTSMAAPHVSATIAMMKQRNPSWTPLWHRCVLADTARDLASQGFDSSTGWGEVDSGAATSHTGEAWSDVGTEWFAPAADFVADNGIAFGYDDCTFGPSQQITRAESVTMLVRAMGIAPVGSPTGIFPDVPINSPFAPFIEAAALQGWVVGYPDGTFGPDEVITRAELATMVTRAEGFITAGGPGSPFSDVLPGAWYYDAVVAASQHGVVNGYPDGTFRPTNNITRAETAQVLLNAS